MSVEHLASSICPQISDTPITTLVCTYPRYIHSELMTHRVFSRNSASSRAIPTKKLIERVRTDPVVPRAFGKNKPGMQAGDEIDIYARIEAREQWLEAANNAADQAEKMAALGVHKQVVNRLLEPFLWHTTIITATEWDNFFELRLSPKAQPEFEHLARLMKIAMGLCEPTPLGILDWHLPFIRMDERDLPLAVQRQVSAARCARVSYLTHDGERDIQKDVDLFQRLTADKHMSPLEHVAQPYRGQHANFANWKQLRHSLSHWQQ